MPELADATTAAHHTEWLCPQSNPRIFAKLQVVAAIRHVVKRPRAYLERGFLQIYNNGGGG